MHWFAFTAVFIGLGSASVFAASTETANSASSLPSFGPLEFLKPILIKAVGENTLLAVQNNLVNLLTALKSGDSGQILNVVLSIVDPQHVVRDGLKMLSNYGSHLWDPQFHQAIAGVLKGISKALKSGIACFSQNIEGTMDNFTSNSINAMKTAFESSRPNSTQPASTGLSAAPTTIINTLRLIIQMVTGSSMRGAVVAGLTSTIGSFNNSLQCALQNTTDLKKSWQSLGTILMSNSTAAPQTLVAPTTATSVIGYWASPTTAAPTVAPSFSASTTTQRSKFLGLF